MNHCWCEVGSDDPEHTVGSKQTCDCMLYSVLKALGVLPAAKLRKNVPFLPILLDCASNQWRTFIVSADDGEGTPVPIPNTAVKLTRADDTWLEAAW